jgi:hypothetical protein
MMQLHLRHYLRRFRLEWIAFVCISATASVLTLRWPEDIPDMPLSVLEALAFTWFTLRIMQAEPVFQTHGGWRVRPICKSSLSQARWVLFLSALLPVLLLRGWCLHQAVDLSGTGWRHALWREWLPWLAVLLAAAGMVSLIGKRAGDTGRPRWSLMIMGIIAAAVVVTIGSAITQAGRLGPGMSGGGYDGRQLGNHPQLPNGERMMTMSDRAGGKAVARKPLRELLRLPFKTGAAAALPGMQVRITACQPAGMRAAFAMHIAGLPWRLRALGEHPFFAVRYPGGIWSPQVKYEHRRQSSRLAAMGYARLEESGDFMSPMSEPWNRRSWPELLASAELVLFEPDPDGQLYQPEELPPPAWSIGEKETTLDLPELPPHPTPQQLQKAAQAAVDQLHAGAWGEQKHHGLVLLEKGGAALVEPVLACGPFGMEAWAMLEPFLIKHATEAHLPIMLRLLEKDGRIGSVMVQKGWKAQALPLLRRHLLDGLPLTMPGLVALAEEKDAALAPMLRQRLLIIGRSRREQDSDRLADALREHPGIVWTELLGDYWYAAGHGGRMWTEKCAATGDRIIFREMAGFWLRATKLPNKATLHSWISASAWDGELTGFPAWLRTNMASLVWDPASQRWHLPPAN